MNALDSGVVVDVDFIGLIAGTERLEQLDVGHRSADLLPLQFHSDSPDAAHEPDNGRQGHRTVRLWSVADLVALWEREDLRMERGA